MSTALQELEALGQDNLSRSETEESPPVSIKDEVRSALKDYELESQNQAEEARQNERQRKIQAKQEAEREALKESSDAVIGCLKKEMENDKEFAKVVKENDLPATLIESIAEVADADEAPLIVKELAANEEFTNSLKNVKTEIGAKRLVSKIRKAVLTGGLQPKIPQMLQKNIPNYNPNNMSVQSSDSDFYADVAMRHGI